MRFPLALISVVGIDNLLRAGYSFSNRRPKYTGCADCGKPTKLERCFRCQSSLTSVEAGVNLKYGQEKESTRAAS